MILKFKIFIVGCILMGCGSNTDNKHQSAFVEQRKSDMPTQKNSSEPDSLKFCFEVSLLRKMDSLGYEIDSVKNIPLTTDKRKEISSIITRDLYHPYLHFVDDIIKFRLFFMSKKDNETSKHEKEIENFRGTLRLYSWEFESKNTIEEIRDNYDSLMNLSLQPASYAFYDLKCVVVWFLMDRSGKTTPQFNDVGRIFQ